MREFTVRLPDQLGEWVDEQASGERSKAAVLRDAVRAAANDAGPYAADMASDAVSRDEFDALRERVERLEQQRRETPRDDAVSDRRRDTTLTTDTDAQQPAATREPDEPDASDEADVRGLLDGWDHGRGEDEREASRQIAVRSLRWLRERGDAVRRADVPLDEWAADDPLDRAVDTLWTEVVRDAWQHTDAVEQPHARGYQWTAE